MADESQVDDIPDVSLMGDDIQTTTDDTPGDTTAEQATDEGAESQDDTKEQGEETSEGQPEPTEGEQPQQVPAKDEEAERRAQNEHYARQRIQERERTKQAVAKQIDQSYGPKTAEELVEEGLSEYQAQVEALRQDVQFERQKTQIAELNSSMQVEAVNVFNDFPVFNEKSPEYDPEFAAMVEQQYRQASRLETDESGIVINAELPLYDYYEKMANIYNRGATKGQQKESANVAETLSRVENPGGSSSTSRSGNSLEDLEERLGDMVIT